MLPAPRMPRKNKNRPPVGPYTYKGVVEEIERLVLRKGHGSQKELASFIGLTEQQFSKRLHDAGARFDLEQISAIAAWATDEKGRPAPLGWPWIPWDVASRLRLG